MWWQILPAMAIVGGALYFPHIGVYVINKIFLGNPYLRLIDKDYEGQMFLRDYRLTKNVYIQNGLDSLPEEEQPKDEQPIDEQPIDEQPKEE